MAWPANAAAKATNALIKKLIQLRKLNGSLGLDSAAALLANNSKSALSFSRVAAGNKVIVVANLSNKPAKVVVNTSALIGSYFDLASGKKVKLAKSTTLAMPKYGFVVYSTVAAK